MSSRRLRLVSSVLALLLPLAIAGSALAAPPAGDDVKLEHRLDIVKGKGKHLALKVDYPASWSQETTIFYNSVKLVDVPRGQQGSVQSTAAVKISTEKRLDHADALGRIRSFAAGIGADPKDFLTLGGWPALQTTYKEVRSQPERRYRYADLEVVRVVTLVAAGDVLVWIDANLPSKPAGRLLAEARAIAKSVAFESAGKPDDVHAEVEALRQGQGNAKENRNARLEQMQREAAMSAPAPEAGASMLAESGSDLPGFNQRVLFSGFGEIEIAVSPDGQNVVIGRQGDWVGSNDGGETFPNTGSVGLFNCGDPSMAYGLSGAFYYAGIHCGCSAGSYTSFPAPGAGPFGFDCDSITRSTDNGVTFPSTGTPIVVCEQCDPTGAANPAGCCLPDQEHIVADRFNAGGGGDQIYSAWRNFDVTDQDAAIVCSQDNGVTWTAPLDLPGTNVFPRIAAGSDGFVYVATKDGANLNLHKLTSCANGLTVVPGWPVNVAPQPAAPCDFKGHDRCDQNALSQTVIVSDTNPNLLYYAHVITAGVNSDNVFVQRSLDGGFTWGPLVQANAGLPGERIMPWLCSTGGDAYATWFDRRAAPVCLTPPCNSVNNDRTDFYGAKLSIDFGGNLQADGDFVISEGPDNWCASGWPSGGPRSIGAAEECSVQPQLAGTCFDTLGNGNAADDVNLGQRCDFSNCNGGNVDIVYPDADCECTAGDQTNIQCQTGGGRPKYGDYNGNACAAGRLYAGWPSRLSPSGVAPATSNIGILFDSLIVDEVPAIQVPGDVDFEATCGSASAVEGTLTVCNTGTATLEIEPITSDDPQFAVTPPSGGYPVNISPDFCFPFEVVFDWNGTDPAPAGNLTISSNDPVNPTVVVPVTASTSSGQPNIVTTIAPSGNFGDVCIGDHGDLELTIQNSGDCALTVTAVTSDDLEFTVGTISALPMTIAAGDSVMVPIRFTPVGATGAESANITIASNDPGTPSHVVPLAGNSPAATTSLFVANAAYFGNVCSGDFHDLDVTVTNTGACPVNVSAVGVSGTNAVEWDVPATFGNVVLEPQNVFHFPLRFSPDDFTPPSARAAQVDVTWRTHLSTDGTTITSLGITGDVPPPDINVPAANQTVEFGNVCATATAEQDIPVCNTGLCTLNVTSASLGACDDFTIVQNPFPSLVSHDFCMSVRVQYTPTEEGEHSCTLTILSDDPDESSVIVNLHGTTPSTIIDIPASLDFAPEVVQTIDACSTFQKYPVSNNGICPLTITNMEISVPDSEDPEDFSLDGLPSFPIILQTGHIAGEGDLEVEFAPYQDPLPNHLDRDNLAILAVTYISDSVTGDLTTVDVPLCGESVLTGARVLVTNHGTPVDVVERIQIQRINANRNRRPQLDTVSVLQNVWLSTVTPTGPCQEFQYHSEYGTVANPLQLLPGVYQVNVTIRANGRRYTKSVGFSVNACDFNPTVVVTFATP